MKKQFLIFGIMFSIFMHSQNGKETINTKEANFILDNYIKKTVKNENPKPNEYKSARNFLYYDFDEDGDKDLYAFFTLEGFGGGNNWQHYLAIFEIENGQIKSADDLVLFGDSMKKYNNGEFVKFSDGYLYYRLHGYDWETKKKFFKTIGFSMFNKQIVTDKEF